MNFDLVLLIAVAAIFAAACVAALRRSAAGRARTLLTIGIVGITAALVLRTWIGSTADRFRTDHADYPMQTEAGGYVSSNACKACHPREYTTWHASYHRTMTQRPSPESVAGVFEVSLQKGDQRFDLKQSGTRYLVDLPAQPWWHHATSTGRIERPVELMTGSHHYQVYWLSSGNTRVLAQLPFVYLIAEKMWMPRQSVFMAPPTETLDSEYARWNTTCIQCHTTGSRPRPQLPYKDVAYSELGEYGIACEACHGPGGEHVQRMSNPLRRYSARLGVTPASGIVNPKRLPAERSAQVCGQCHSVHEMHHDEVDRWITTGATYRPGDDLSKTRELITGEAARHDPEHFWPDGAVRVSGRELNGLIESPCYKSGKFSCITCHEPHKQESDPRSLTQWRISLLRPFEQENGACVQCHEKIGADPAGHTHHVAQSSGSACVNCHMPHTVYGLAKAARDHRIASPSVATELATGRPNACNLCHVDRTLAWTGQHLAHWYGQQTPALSDDQEQIAASLLWLYRGDAHQRALAMWAMGWEPARAVAGERWALPHLVRAIGDPYQVLGLVAWRSLRNIVGGDALPGSILAQPPSGRVGATAARVGMGDAVDETAIARLIEQRDNRPVRLSE